MKKLVLAFMMGAVAMAANAQVNYKVQTACHPQDVKHYDTELLRSRFMMDKVMAPDEINVTYTLYDRLIYGGAMPVNKTLKLEVFRELGPEITYFLERRELGVINTGGDGVVTVDGKEYFVPGQIFPDPGNNAFRLRLIPQIRMKRGTEKKDERASEKAAEPLGPFMECQPAFHVFPLFFRESGNMERELLQERENGHAC